MIPHTLLLAAMLLAFLLGMFGWQARWFVLVLWVGAVLWSLLLGLL